MEVAKSLFSRVSETTAPLPGQALPFLTAARIWIFTAIAFVLPMKAAFVYSLSALLLLVWMAEGRFAEKAMAIFRSRLCLAFIAYYAAFVVGMLWTEDTVAGWEMVDRQTPFLLFLLYWSSAEPAYKARYISAFLAGLAVCAVLAHYNWLQLHWFPEWPRGIRVFKDPVDTAPFVDRIMYAPLLALGAYFSLRRSISLAGLMPRAIFAALTCVLLSNLIFSGGRAGMVMFAALCIALAFEKTKSRGKALLVCAISFPIVLAGLYSTHSYFTDRVNIALEDIETFEQNPNTSLGQRLVFWTTSFRLFINHPVTGVGSGDFHKEYARIKPSRWEATPDSYNPHNQFLLTGATTGLLGLTALLLIFYFAAKSAGDSTTSAVLIGFAVVCLFESYLWRSNTSLAFAAIIAALTARQRSVSNAKISES
jgi:O-antigen ligase